MRSMPPQEPYVRAMRVWARPGALGAVNTPAARRFVELHSDDLAVIFCKDSRFVYADIGRDFPRLCLHAGERCDLGKPVEGTISEFDEVAADDWLQSPPRACELSAQTLWQANGRSITLLRADQSDDEGPGFDDAFERFAVGRNR